MIAGVDLHGARVLLVEDDLDLRETIAEILGEAGASVSTAASGNEGFAAVARDRPQVIVSDLWMADGSGFELIERVRKLSPDEAGLTPAIALSAAENMQEAIMAGFHAFVPKPFEAQRLLATVADFVHPDDSTPAHARWTLTSPRAGVVVITLTGDVRSADIRSMSEALVIHLKHGPCDVVSNLRGLTGFSPSVGSVAERTLWRVRRSIRSVRVVGGSVAARLVSAAACALLGIPCTFRDTAG
jgi:CheY-like chemotaxis protein